MKMRHFLMLAVCLLGLEACASGPKTEKIELFNGKDLQGWVGYVDPSAGIPASQVYSVENGCLKISGTPFGYIRTDRKFTDYTLHAEWRWIGEASNSGLINRIQSPDQLWPVALESNLMHGGVGHLVGMGGYKFEGGVASNEFWFMKATGDQANEKAAGEWNTSEVIVKGTSITSYLNGALMSQIDDFQLEGGFIGLQSEGGPLEFRAVWVEVEK